MNPQPIFPSGLHWIDISRPLGPATPVWPGDQPVEVEAARWTNEAGRVIEVRRLRLSLHAGTHVDAPRHMLPEGAPVGEYPLSGCLQPARVVDAGGSGTITRGDVASLAGPAAVLFRTRPVPPPDGFRADFPGIAAEAARHLAGCGVRLVGTDAPSVDPFDSTDLPAHHILFGAGAYILENLRLDHVPPGNYLLLLAPLPLGEAEASPVRPLLAKIGEIGESVELTGDR
jgi:arylformamidase